MKPVRSRGKATGVLVTPEDSDRLTERERFVAAVEQGLVEADAGLLISNEELTDHFERRFRHSED